MSTTINGVTLQVRRTDDLKIGGTVVLKVEASDFNSLSQAVATAKERGPQINYIPVITKMQSLATAIIYFVKTLN